MSDSASTMPNHLAHETSPYLLQHAHNPVDWWPWGEAAFAEARTSHRPILLSIGYAACHWCHVMAHESFENAETAALMNRDFVCIKVDREERPDVDALYMKALYLMGEHGGWPLTMALTPEGKPFWGGTYFPPTGRWGRPGFREVLGGLARAWLDKADTIADTAHRLTEALAEAPSIPVMLSPDLLDQAAHRLLKMVDAEHGGLRGAPKFPMASAFELLWRAWARSGNPLYKDAVIKTLNGLCNGGIYDHLGDGLARYSTDYHWLAPHFEKMLYDNAQLIDLLTEVWQETKTPLYAERVAGIVDWLRREMIAEDDTFAATLDADSEGEEGRFYVWTAEAINRLLGNDAPLFSRVYDVQFGGNWEHGNNILHRHHHAGGLLADTDEATLARCRAILLAERDTRIRPGRDDKVLADWNGLMIAALAKAAAVFDRPDWLALAERAFTGVVRLLGRPDHRLVHATRAGKSTDNGILDDYAMMARAACALFEATGRHSYLDTAIGWASTADALFSAENAGWYLTSTEARDLIVRTRTVFDSATPSGVGVLTGVFARLFWITGEARFGDRAESAIAALGGEALNGSPSTAALLNAAELLNAGVQVTLIGDSGDTRALRQAALSIAEPNLVFALPKAGQEALDGKPTAYVCHGPICLAPVTEPAALLRALQRG